MLVPDCSTESHTPWRNKFLKERTPSRYGPSHRPRSAHLRNGGNPVHLLQAAIGPVQDFIASARRTRDLWFGSWLLSEVSKAVARAIVHHTGDPRSLIFPSVERLAELDPESSLSVANKVLAIVEDPRSVADLIRPAAQARLEALAEEAFARMSAGDRYVKLDRARKQIADLLEVYVVSVPIAEAHYKETRDRCERLLAARKGTRDFEPVSWGATVDKSTLDGQREIVIDIDATKSLSETALFQALGIRRGESLCGIGLFKRHGAKDDAVPVYSTSHVASLPFIDGLATGDAELVKRYASTLHSLGAAELTQPVRSHPVFGRYDGHMLYLERLSDLVGEAKVDEAGRALAQLLRDCGQKRGPLPYYALLVADGDRMGKAIDACTSVERHRALSSALSKFAGEADKIVKGHGGSLIYAGGDDVLAFVGLHKAVACARKLADAFATLLAGFTHTEGGQTLSPTLSVGIGVSHHLEPLGDALEVARKAEKLAKMTRNALGLIVAKRGGSENAVSGRWSEKPAPIDERLATWVTMHRNQQIPDGAAYELAELGRRLGGISGSLTEEQRSIAIEESSRVMRRKRAERGTRDMSEGDVHEVLERIRSSPDGLATTSSELIAARLLADAVDLAEPKLEKERISYP